ncbi:AAA family ATPase [Sphingorhabdus sp.]|uniref:AAA family ATPase n=1 Tax=Sphingorhabdus sp. TaxID=1902408 RepID=UPI0035B35A73
MEHDFENGRIASSGDGRVSPSIDPKTITITPAKATPKPDASPEMAEVELWTKAGFPSVTSTDGEASVQFILPENCIAFYHRQDADRTPFIDFQKAIGVFPNCRYQVQDGAVYIYRLSATGDLTKLKYISPDGVELLKPGASVPLPEFNSYMAEELSAKHFDDVVTVNSDHIADAAELLGIPWPPIVPAPVAKEVPLLKFSLQGKADELREKALAATPLLGQVCRSGQATIWYAPPNSGKTLIGLSLAGEAIRERRLEPGNLYYVNADDNSMGLAQKARIFDDWGAHMLVPGFKDFRAAELQNLLIEMARSDKARGVVLIIDTIKKFASLMDKKDSSRFADACRQFVLQGGTVLALAHTNKNPSASGRLKYAGTTDLVEDFDAAFIIEPIDLEQPGGEKVVRFESEKRRGDTPEKAAFAYSTENGLTYEQLLASVEAVTFDRLGEIERTIEQRTDIELVETVKACIRDGITTKMHIASEAAKRSKTSGKGIIRILDRYAGDDPADHHWTFTVGERGKHIFQLLSADDPGDPTSG